MTIVKKAKQNQTQPTSLLDFTEKILFLCPMAKKKYMTEPAKLSENDSEVTEDMNASHFHTRATSQRQNQSKSTHSSHFRQIFMSELFAQLSIFHYSNCWKHYCTWNSMDGSLNQTSTTSTASRAFFCASRQHFSNDEKSKIPQFSSLWTQHKLSLHYTPGKVWAIHAPAHSLLLLSKFNCKQWGFAIVTLSITL